MCRTFVRLLAADVVVVVVVAVVVIVIAVVVALQCTRVTLALLTAADINKPRAAVTVADDTQLTVPVDLLLLSRMNFLSGPLCDSDDTPCFRCYGAQRKGESLPGAATVSQNHVGLYGKPPPAPSVIRCMRNNFDGHLNIFCCFN